jgi:hypothetical protein
MDSISFPRVATNGSTYFKEYCLVSLLGKRQPEIDNILSKVNCDAQGLYEWYYKQQLPDHSNEHDDVYWVVIALWSRMDTIVTASNQRTRRRQ